MRKTARRGIAASKASRLEGLTIPEDTRCNPRRDPAGSLSPKQAQIYAEVMARGMDGTQVRDVNPCDIAHVTTKRILDHLVSLGLLQSRDERRQRYAARVYYPAGRRLPPLRDYMTPEARAVLQYLDQHGPSTPPQMFRAGLLIQAGNGYYRIEHLETLRLVTAARSPGKATILTLTAAGRREARRS